MESTSAEPSFTGSGVEQQIYMKDAGGNFYRLEVIQGNIFSETGATFRLFQKIESSWINLGERVSNHPIKKGRPLWGVITVDSFYIHWLR